MRRLSPAQLSRILAFASISFVGILLIFGSVWAFQRGGQDFDVFYHAWKLVLDGRGKEIYVNSPDRYLYAPGFAWLLSPLALFPRDSAFLLWCLAKGKVVAWMILAVSRGLPGKVRLHRIGLAAAGVILVARPLLIDWGYGQVNTFILGAALWALLVHVAPPARKESRRVAFISWAILACAAVAKIFPLPLLIIPFLPFKGVPFERRRAEIQGVLAGILLLGILPAVSVGFSGALELVLGWKGALVSKGLPLVSHNQSFVAFLHHYFSGNPTHVIAQGWVRQPLGVQLFDSEAIMLLSFAWTFLCAGFLLAWLLVGPKTDSLKWISVAIATLILPAHLVWKPYFVMGFPLTTWILSRGSYAFAAFLFVIINLTSFEFIGHVWAGRLESASILLFAQLALIGYALTRKVGAR